MARFAIGDVQGCATELRALLTRLKFSADRDQLWFVGDLVNRGPESLECLRLIRAFGDNAVVVLAITTCTCSPEATAPISGINPATRSPGSCVRPIASYFCSGCWSGHSRTRIRRMVNCWCTRSRAAVDRDSDSVPVEGGTDRAPGRTRRLLEHSMATSPTCGLRNCAAPIGSDSSSIR